MSAPALHAEGVRKVYGGEVALADAGVVVERGEIHALVGANGAGKSTLVRILCGVERPDAGAIAVGGRTLAVPYGPAAAREAGIAHIHQDRALVGDLSIAENIALSLGYPMRAGLLSMRAMRTQARRSLATVHIEHDVDAPVKELPIADQTMVAIARA